MAKCIFLGRFQPLHRGHHKIINENKGSFENFQIFIGSSDKSRTQENPLSFKERKEIIKECFPELKIKPIEDEEKSAEGNQKWVQKIQESGADKIISGNSLVQKLIKEHTSIELIKPEKEDPEIFSGSEIRRRIRSGGEWRYLIPSCAKEKISEYEEVIKETGINYEFKPGWKKENAYHGTADDKKNN